MAESTLLGFRTRAALVLLGTALVGAGVFVGFLWVVGFGVGLSEPRAPTHGEATLAMVWALCGFVLLGTGIVSLACRTRRGLRVVGGLAALAAATLALCFLLEHLLG